MNDEHEDVFTDELATSLRATAASAPRSADPYGPLGKAIASDRRRRRAGIGASLAVVAVVGGAIGIGSEVGRGSSASAQSPAAGTYTATPAAPATSPPSSPAKAAVPPASSTSTPPPAPTTTDQEMMFGWPADYSLFSGYLSSKAAAGPTVDAMIHAYGRPVSGGTRNVLVNLVGSFKLCGYSLDSYTFSLRWAGNLAHSGGSGTAIVDVSHQGATFRMVGTDSYKGVWLQLPAAVDATEAPSTEAVAQPELDQPAQVFYATVWAAPGSKVTVTATTPATFGSTQTTAKTYSPVTVGASGVTEVELTTRGANGYLPYPTITGVTVVRPDGTTATAPLLGNTTPADESAARSLLPANTTCPGVHPETPLS